MRGPSCIPCAARPTVRPEITENPGPRKGEEQNTWRPAQQDQLCFHGGNLHQPRHYSLYVGLQFKACYDGTETPAYRLQEVHRRD
ncbi:hypothetical protein JOD53_001690 [Brevibacterium luteolum]|nr:hypothetical protein [Brevibacterium luteolum]